MLNWKEAQHPPLGEPRCHPKARLKRAEMGPVVSIYTKIM